jgi:hypothetical protein
LNAGCFFEEIQSKMMKTDSINVVLFWNMGVMVLYTLVVMGILGLFKDIYHIFKYDFSYYQKSVVISILNVIAQFLVVLLKEVKIFINYIFTFVLL